jgi:hypothetical protein
MSLTKLVKVFLRALEGLFGNLLLVFCDLLFILSFLQGISEIDNFLFQDLIRSLSQVEIALNFFGLSGHLLDSLFLL